jgi:hypothetical protein
LKWRLISNVWKSYITSPHCFWAGGFGSLAFFNNNVNQNAYFNTLSQKLLPWFLELSDKYDKDFIFKQDGATCHTGGYTTW